MKLTDIMASFLLMGAADCPLLRRSYETDGLSTAKPRSSPQHHHGKAYDILCIRCFLS